jgi:hypothetical protein
VALDAHGDVFSEILAVFDVAAWQNARGLRLLRRRDSWSTRAAQRNGKA